MRPTFVMNVPCRGGLWGSPRWVTPVVRGLLVVKLTGGVFLTAGGCASWSHAQAGIVGSAIHTGWLAVDRGVRVLHIWRWGRTPHVGV